MDENAGNVQIILMLNYSSLCATSCMKSETLREYSSALGEQSALPEGSALPQRRRMCIVEAKPPARFGNIRFAALIFLKKKKTFVFPRLSPFFYSAANKQQPRMSPNSLSVTTVTLGFRLFFILLQINLLTYHGLHFIESS